MLLVPLLVAGPAAPAASQSMLAPSVVPVSAGAILGLFGALVGGIIPK